MDVERRANTILFAGGGTGGHLYPALAVAAELRRRLPGCTLGFIGARGGLEQRLVPAAGYPLRLLRLSGLKGAGGTAALGAAAAAAWAVLRCALWLRRERPDLVVGAGGFASGPAVLAAWSLRMRTMLLEQNHFPGATNRWLAPRADAVCVPSAHAERRIGGRRFVTGNPVRDEFFAIGPPPAGPEPALLAFGGSRGARSLNRALGAALAPLARRVPAPRIVHQTGESDLERARAAGGDYPQGRYEAHAFLDDMPARLAAADLVLCRAGATTVAELCAAGRPAILVPYPHAADDHQRYNAASLVEAGAALMVEDRDLDGERLAAVVADLLADPARLRGMGRAAHSLARPDATRRIADIAERLLEGPLDEAA